MPNSSAAFKKQKKILIVEDNETNFRLAEYILAQSGYGVDWAKNGMNALEKTLHNSYDLILMDIHMPKMDGFQTASSIKEQGHRVPIVAVTAGTIQGDPLSLPDYIDDHLLKPYTKEALLKKIDRILCSPTIPEDRTPGENSAYEEILNWLDFERILENTQGDIKLLKKMTEALSRRTKTLFAEISLSSERQDLLLLSEQCHALKGTLGNFTTEGPFKKAALIEHLAAKGASTEISSHLQPLWEQIELLQNFLNNHLHKLPSSQ